VGVPAGGDEGDVFYGRSSDGGVIFSDGMNDACWKVVKRA